MPDTYHIIFTRRAASDLEGIFNYIANRSPGTAPRIIERLVNAIDSLATFPHRYRVIDPQPRIRGEIRMMPVSPYLVYYRILQSQSAVRVITVRHGSRTRPEEIE